LRIPTLLLLLGLFVSAWNFGSEVPTKIPEAKPWEGSYSLPSGGRFDVKAEGNDLVLEPRNQTALTALGCRRDETPSREYIGLTELAVDKLIKNDLKAFRKEAGTSRVMTWFVKKSWKGMIDTMGRPTSFQYIGTIPDGAEMASVVKVQLESGSQFFCLRWKERKVKSVSHGHRFPGVPWFNPGPASTFVPSVSYQGASQWTRLTFDLDPFGNITGMNLYSADGTNVLVAERVKE